MTDTHQAAPLEDYIQRYYAGVQKDFADAIGVKPPQITQWIAKGFVVANHTLYSPRRELKKPERI